MVAGLGLFSKVQLAICGRRGSLKGMLGWSINLFRVRGIQISLHFSFLLLLAYFCEQGWKEAGAAGMYWSGAMLLAFFVCVVLHELGHSFMAMRFGVRVRRILLMPLGGMAEFDAIPKNPRRELLITAAGPAVNLVIAALLYVVVRVPPGGGDFVVPTSLSQLGLVLLLANIVMFLFNLIPAFPMDGGRILRACLAFRLPYVRATYWAVMVAKPITILGLVYTVWTSNWLLAAICVMIFLFGDAEYRTVKRQQLAEDQVREAFHRLYQGHTIEEPPILR
jgi:Zn-dependent protease